MYLVQVLPKDRFGEMISFEFHLEKWYEKTRHRCGFWFFEPISFSVLNFGCGGGICWPCQKHSRIGHSAGLVPDTPCFSLVALALPSTGRARAPSPLPPPSVVEGTNPSLSRNKRKQPPCGDCFFRLASQTKKDIILSFYSSSNSDSRTVIVSINCIRVYSLLFFQSQIKPSGKNTSSSGIFPKLKYLI